MPTILCEVVPSADPNDRSLEKSYVYAHGQVLAQQDYTQNPTGRYYYLADRLGSVRQVLDNAGNVVNAYTYKPFGEDFTNAYIETVENPFKFTGQYFDTEINQYYLRARMYDPQLMQFTTRDSADGKFQEPLTLHKYIYCINNPATYVDLNGREFSLPELLVSMGQGAIAGGFTGTFLETGYQMGVAFAGGEFDAEAIIDAAIKGVEYGAVSGFAIGVSGSIALMKASTLVSTQLASKWYILEAGAMAFGFGNTKITADGEKTRELTNRELWLTSELTRYLPQE